jgi:hypothetical protein
MDSDLGVSSRRSGFRRMAEWGSAFARRHGWHGLNIVIPAFMLVYAAMAAVLCFGFGNSAEFRPMLYLPAFGVSYLMFGAIPLVIVLRRAFGRSARPFPFFPRVWSPREFLRSLIAAAPFLIAWPIFMAGFTAMKNLLNDVVPFTWDTTLMEMDRAMHFGRHPWQWLAIENPLVTRALESAYAFWGVLLVAVPFAVALGRAGSPARTRFLISIILVFILLGNIAAGAFMSAGPFWFEFTGAPRNDYAGLFAYLMQVDPNGDFSAIAFQRYLWQAYIEGGTELGSGISAFPSIHVAVAALYALYAWPLGHLPRLAATTYLLLIMVGAVHLGWHYAVDCYAGFLGAAMIYGAVGAVQRRHARLIAAEPAVQSAPA